jgi:hypothetical protein
VIAFKRLDCDLKSRNVLIDKDWNAKLCVLLARVCMYDCDDVRGAGDFGLSMVRTDKRVRLAGTRG